MSSEIISQGVVKIAPMQEQVKPIVHKDLGEQAGHVETFSAPISAPYELYAQLNIDPFKATDTEKKWIGEVYQYAKDQTPEAYRNNGNIMYKIAEIKSRFSAGERTLHKVYEWVKLSKQTNELKRQLNIKSQIDDLTKQQEALSS